MYDKYVLMEVIQAQAQAASTMTAINSKGIA